jgi:mRNA-degrading endonuclease RelE of RelBE toxin-antitoxin system
LKSCTAMPYNQLQNMRVVALPEFLARVRRLLSDEDRAEFADYIGMNPESGKVIPGLGGIRKVRWGRGNIGKRGGVRIVYLYAVVKSTVYLLTIYSKAQQADLTTAQKKALVGIVAALKGE